MLVFPVQTDHEQDWHPHPVGPYSAIFDDYTYIPGILHTYIKTVTPIQVHRNRDKSTRRTWIKLNYVILYSRVWDRVYYFSKITK